MENENQISAKPNWNSLFIIFLLIISALGIIIWFGNPQWKYKLVLRNIPFYKTRAPVDTDDAFRKLENGMEKEEVLRLLGRPVDLNGREIPDKNLLSKNKSFWVYNWSNYTNYLIIFFDNTGRVTNYGLK